MLVPTFWKNFLPPFAYHPYSDKWRHKFLQKSDYHLPGYTVFQPSTRLHSFITIYQNTECYNCPPDYTTLQHLPYYTVLQSSTRLHCSITVQETTQCYNHLPNYTVLSPLSRLHTVMTNFQITLFTLCSLEVRCTLCCNHLPE